MPDTVYVEQIERIYNELWKTSAAKLEIIELVLEL